MIAVMFIAAFLASPNIDETARLRAARFNTQSSAHELEDCLRSGLASLREENRTEPIATLIDGTFGLCANPENEYDDALRELSRAVGLAPSNPSTQNIMHEHKLEIRRNFTGWALKR